mmetsp:Transcript_21417/g.40786  ORF Transcript_21417/g.40786 Transcript_21417/m.40786 type:complete len:228 (+) Transcript_21417:254-937(+)
MPVQRVHPGGHGGVPGAAAAHQHVPPGVRVQLGGRDEAADDSFLLERPVLHVLPPAHQHRHRGHLRRLGYSARALEGRGDLPVCGGRQGQVPLHRGVHHVPRDEQHGRLVHHPQHLAVLRQRGGHLLLLVRGAQAVHQAGAAGGDPGTVLDHLLAHSAGDARRLELARVPGEHGDGRAAEAVLRLAGQGMRHPRGVLRLDRLHHQQLLGPGQHFLRRGRQRHLVGRL